MSSVREGALGKEKRKDIWQGLVQLSRAISEFKYIRAGKTDPGKSVLVASNFSVEIVTVKPLPDK